MDKTTIEEVTDNLYMFQSRFGKIDEFGWWNLEIISSDACTPYPVPPTQPTELLNAMEQSTYQRNWTQTNHCQTHHQANLICQMTAKTSNTKARDAIKNKKCWKCTKQDSSDSSSNDSDYSNEVQYKSKRHNNRKSHRKRNLSNYVQS